MDGWITIGAKIDSKQLEKDIKENKSKLRQLEKDEEKLLEKKASVEFDISEFKKKISEIKAETDKDLQLAVTDEQTAFVLDMEQQQLQRINEQYGETINKSNEINSQIQANRNEQQLLTQEVARMNGELAQTETINGLKKGMKDVGKEISSNIKKVGKWALAIFGVRSIYSGIRSAMSTISQYDDQLKADLDYIKYSLAMTLQPIIQWIVEKVYTLMQYLNYIWSAVFGKPLFTKTAKDFASANKSAKELSKTIAGFDEMNILSESSSGGAGSTMPSFDVSEFQDVEIPEWVEKLKEILKWIVDNKDLVIEGITGIGSAVAGLGIVSWINKLDILSKKLGFKDALGIGSIIWGLIDVIGNLKENWDILDASAENNGTTIEGWGKTVEGVGKIVMGIGLLTGNVIVILIGLIITLGGLIMEKWHEMSNFLKNIADMCESTGTGIGTFFGGVVRSIENTFGGSLTSLKQFLDGILLFFKGDFKNGFANIGKSIVNSWILVINGALMYTQAIWNGILAGIDNVGKEFGKSWNLSKYKWNWQIPYLAQGGIVNMPSRGVPVGSALAGERGPEGVVPLTNSQMMEQLGQTIGKYITINASITNTMDGRVISKEIKKIQNQMDFASNR